MLSCSKAVVTPVKYECKTNMNLIHNFAQKNILFEKLINGTSVTTRPGQLFSQHTLPCMKYHTQAVKLMTETSVTPTPRQQPFLQQHVPTFSSLSAFPCALSQAHTFLFRRLSCQIAGEMDGPMDDWDFLIAAKFNLGAINITCRVSETVMEGCSWLASKC